MTTLDVDIEESIKRYIKHVRQMALLTDEQITLLLRQKAIEDPAMFESLKIGATKKMIAEVKKAAKDIRGDARKFARQVDDFT